MEKQIQFDFSKVVPDAMFGGVEKTQLTGGQWRLSGWAICCDKATHEFFAPQIIFALVENAVIATAVPKTIRSDIAAHYRVSDLQQYFGFSISVPATTAATPDAVRLYAAYDSNTFFPITLPALLGGQSMLEYKYSFIKTLMDRLLREQVTGEISPADTMQNEHYQGVGQSAAMAVIQAILSANTSDVRNILDMPCGHGRVARYLRALFPYSLLDCCDIDRDGVDFCAEIFNARGIYSAHDIRHINFDRTYNLIWIGSMFTHFRAATVLLWLERMLDLLAPNGIIVATLHGRGHLSYIRQGLYSDSPSQESLASLCESYQKSEWGYVNYLNKPSEGMEKADGNEYGVSLCRPATFMAMLEKIPQAKVYSYTEEGWAAHQDVVVIGR